jgi:hypothetical protein
MWSELRGLISFGLLLLGLAACSSDATGPKEVKWDRDACERCRMVLSDRYSSAQVRYLPPQRKRPQVAMFDDFGCAVLWLQDKPWRDDPRTEFWITDHLTGEWIDARQATYLPGQMTPMEYGLGAQLEWQEGGLSFAQAKRHVARVEQRFDAQGVQLLEQYREQAQRRRTHRDSHREEAELPHITQERE